MKLAVSPPPGTGAWPTRTLVPGFSMAGVPELITLIGVAGVTTMCRVPPS